MAWFSRVLRVRPKEQDAQKQPEIVLVTSGPASEGATPSASMNLAAGPPVSSAAQEHEPPPAIAVPAASSEYAEAFLQWCAAHGFGGFTPWKRVRDLGFEFADHEGRVPLSPMALSKALKEIGLSRRQRYVRVYEPDYRLQVERGNKRPREFLIELPALGERSTDDQSWSDND